MKKKLSQSNYKNLDTEELRQLLETETGDINAAAEKLINDRGNFCERFKPVAKMFRVNYAKLFSNYGIQKNADIQNSVTQFLWHKLILKKKRLDKKGITLKSSIEPVIVRGKDPLIGHEVFDGKYEVGLLKETVQGKERYYIEEKQIYEVNDFSVLRLRTLDTHKAGKNRIICPSCGAESTRSNLLDGCDYCGTKFFIEDLKMRVCDFTLENDLLVSSNSYFYQNSAFGVYKKIFTILFIVMLPLCIVNIAQFFVMVLGSAFFAAFISLPATFVYEIFIKPFKWVSMENKGVGQLYKRIVAEEARKNQELLKTIHNFDPLFSYEGFYSEIENMLAAVHYAENVKEVQVFWNTPDEQQIKAIIDGYADVMDMQVVTACAKSYQVAEGLQRLSLRVSCKLLCEKDSAVSTKTETIELLLVKSEECKTREVCAPSFLRCSSCGSSLSLMEGAYCQHCGQSKRLADCAWAIEKYSILKN